MVFYAAAFGGKGNEATVIFTEMPMTDPAKMQGIAEHMKTPVTCFLNRADNTIYYYTIKTELPFCVHGSLATAKVLGELYSIQHYDLKNRTNKSIALQMNGDLMSVWVEGVEKFDANIDPLSIESWLQADLLLAGPFSVASIGSKKCFIPVPDHEFLNRVNPDAEKLENWCADQGINGVYLYTETPYYEKLDFQCRSFNPATGMLEDMATGVAAGAVGWVQEGKSQLKIGQGQDNVLNEIQVTLNRQNKTTQISGYARITDSYHS